MNLSEVVAYLAENGLKRDRSTVSKYLKGIGVCAKYGLVQKEAADKILKIHKGVKKNRVEMIPCQDANTFWGSLAYVLKHASEFSMEVTASNK